MVQTVLLYGEQSWVINENVRNKVRGFHNRWARFLARGYVDLSKVKDKWTYPEIKNTLEVAHLLSMLDDYVYQKESVQY